MKFSLYVCIYIYIYRERVRESTVSQIVYRYAALQNLNINRVKFIKINKASGRRRKKLLDDLKDRRGYCRLKEEALDRTMWRNRFGGGFEPVVRQNTE